MGHAAGGAQPALGAIEATTTLPPAAPVAPGAPAATLSAGTFDAPAATAVIEARRTAAMAAEMAGGAGHDHHGATGTYRHFDVGRGAEAVSPRGGAEDEAEPGHTSHGGSSTTPAEHSGHRAGEAAGAHDDSSRHAADQHTTEVAYVCPLHPEVRRGAAGTCPICGHTLERREE